MLRRIGLCFVAAAAVAVGAAASAFATDTTWVNPRGGLWSDASNWSNGVPTAGDTIVLPGLGRGGYSITLGASNVCAGLRVEGGDVTLVNGTVQAGGDALIGVNGNSGTLRLNDAALVVPSVSIGTEGGNGVVDLESGSALVTGPLKVALSASVASSGFLAVDADSLAAATQVTLGAGSTLELEAKFEAGQRLLAQSIVAGGTLTVVPHPTLASPDLYVQLTITPVTGYFATVNPPIVSGTAAPLSVGIGGIILGAAGGGGGGGESDPITSLVIDAPSLTTYVGFQYPITVTAVRKSGSTQTVTSSATFDFPAGDDAAVIVGNKLIPISEGPFTIQATLESDELVITGELSLTAVTDPPISYHRVDISGEGTPGNSAVPWDESFEEIGLGPDMTPDGRFVAFVSFASNLVVPDPPGENVFVKDLWTGEVERLDDDLPLQSLSGLTFGASISDDGRYVTYTKRLAAPGLTTMVWLHDRLRHTNTPMCMKPDGTVAVGQPAYAKLSADGTVVVYAVACDGLIEGVSPTDYHIIAYDVATGVNSLVSVAEDGLPANAGSSLPAVSCDGRYVAFHSLATNLVGGPSTVMRVVVHDRATGANERVDVGPSGGGNGFSKEASISCDGRFVSFTSSATNLAPTDSESKRDVFVRDRLLGTTAHVSPDLPDITLNDGFHRSMISDDGAYVAYLGTSLPVSFGNDKPAHVLRVHVPTLSVDEVALTTWGQAAAASGGNDNWGRNWISADGQRVVFIGDPFLLVPTQPLGVPYGNSQNGLFLRNFASDLPADLTGDGKVNAADLAILLGAWGASGSIADVDRDGVVGPGDLALLLGAWTP